MPPSEKRRSYRQFCGVARALDVVGERWTLLLVRNLLLGPRRYSDLLQELPGITTNLLAKRLVEMEGAGLIERTPVTTAKPGVGYALTEVGRLLEPVVMELGRFGGRYMDRPQEGDRVDLGWGILSSKRRYAGGVRGVIELRADEGRSFVLTFEPARMGVMEGTAIAADATVRGTSKNLLAAFASLDRLVATRAERALTIEGNRMTWRSAFRALSRDR